ncbi:MAG: hypothetical protein JXA77_02880 [Bacteroidales bacterium]|nr:hypothetical protein [Bacteroidales bacterium]MBN2819928.1 hypothetical protein [Bacteroidales bacterium]
MQISEVKSKTDKTRFLNVAREIYKNDKVWVCPPDKDINSIFDPQSNVFYLHGEASRWILKDNKGNLIGRIAAFINYDKQGAEDQPTGGVGFFECIDDEKAAFKLFDTAKCWLEERKMEAMDGPINFGETDKYWGLLVDGFTHPSYEVAYNQPYYQKFFEDYGFKTYFKQEGFHLDISKPIDERFLKIASWVAKKPGYEFKHFTWKDEDKFVQDFCDVYNEAWESFKEDFKPLKPEYIKKTLKKAKVILKEEFVWLAYFEEKPVAIYLMYPDVNQIFKHLNGKLHFINLIRFLNLKRKKTMTRARGVLMGVIPKFQNLGIESAFIYHINEVMKEMPEYKEIEFSWVGDFNPKMRKIFIAVGSVPAKHYITYRYLFDRNKEFKRFPITS